MREIKENARTAAALRGREILAVVGMKHADRFVRRAPNTCPGVWPGAPPGRCVWTVKRHGAAPPWGRGWGLWPATPRTPPGNLRLWHIWGLWRL